MAILTLKSLALKLDVSSRTAQRYMNDLRSTYPNRELTDAHYYAYFEDTTRNIEN